MFVAELDATGSGLAYSTFLGGNDWDWGLGITVDNLGSAYVVGFTRSTDFPTTAGAYSRTYNGGEDAFVAKLDTDGTALEYATYLGGSDEDEASDIAIDEAKMCM